MPELAVALTDAQRQYLVAVGELLLSTWQPDDLQQSLDELAKLDFGCSRWFQRNLQHSR